MWGMLKCFGNKKATRDRNYFCYGLYLLIMQIKGLL